MLKLVILISILLVFGCTKTPDYSGVVPPQPAFRVNKMRVRDNAQSLRTIVFLYDHRNRLIVRKVQETDRVLERFVYDGLELKSVILYDEYGHQAYVNDHPMYSTDFGKVLQFYYLSPSTGGGADTNHIIYQFSEAGITDIKHRIHSPNLPGVSTQHHAHFVYNEMNNLAQYNCIRNGVMVDDREIRSTDYKNNPLKHVSPLVLVFGGLPLHSGTGANNVTSMTVNGREVEYEYQYNEAGFPISIRDKSEGFIRYEFEYGL